MIRSMKRSILFRISLCCLLFASGSVHAAGIAVISHAGIAPYRAAIEGFRSQLGLPLREYHPGRRNEHLDAIKQAIAVQQPDLILALGKSALAISREINHGVPVVFAFVLHPEQGRLGNHPVPHSESGIAMSIPAKEQFRTLLKFVPDIKNIGVVYDPNKSARLVQEASLAAKQLNLHLVAVTALDHKQAAKAIASTFTKVSAMWMVPDTTVLTSTTFRQMVRLSLTSSVALIGLAPKYVRAGSLFALSFDSKALGVQAGQMAKRILKGRKLPALVAPDAIKLVVNRQTAKRLGLTMSASLLKGVAHSYPDSHGDRH